jgi:hypothetical protein
VRATSARWPAVTATVAPAMWMASMGVTVSVVPASLPPCRGRAQSNGEERRECVASGGRERERGVVRHGSPPVVQRLPGRAERGAITVTD